jgi:hypothetical protein
MNSLKPGRYRHFKGEEYQLLMVAHHSETEELLVVYCSVDDPGRIWVRPLAMFVDLVDLPDGRHRRFEPAVETAQSRSSVLRRLLARLLRPWRRLEPEAQIHSAQHRVAAAARRPVFRLNRPHA